MDFVSNHEKKKDPFSSFSTTTTMHYAARMSLAYRCNSKSFRFFQQYDQLYKQWIENWEAGWENNGDAFFLEQKAMWLSLESTFQRLVLSSHLDPYSPSPSPMKKKRKKEEEAEEEEEDECNDSEIREKLFQKYTTNELISRMHAVCIFSRIFSDYMACMKTKPCLSVLTLFYYFHQAKYFFVFCCVPLKARFWNELPLLLFVFVFVCLLYAPMVWSGLVMLISIRNSKKNMDLRIYKQLFNEFSNHYDQLRQEKEGWDDDDEDEDNEEKKKAQKDNGGGGGGGGGGASPTQKNKQNTTTNNTNNTAPLASSSLASSGKKKTKGASLNLTRIVITIMMMIEYGRTDHPLILPFLLNNSEKKKFKEKKEEEEEEKEKTKEVVAVVESVIITNTPPPPPTTTVSTNPNCLADIIALLPVEKKKTKDGVKQQTPPPPTDIYFVLNNASWIVPPFKDILLMTKFGSKRKRTLQLEKNLGGTMPTVIVQLIGDYAQEVSKTSYSKSMNSLFFDKEEEEKEKEKDKNEQEEEEQNTSDNSINEKKEEEQDHHHHTEPFLDFTKTKSKQKIL